MLTKKSVVIQKWMAMCSPFDYEGNFFSKETILYTHMYTYMTKQTYSLSKVIKSKEYSKVWYEVLRSLLNHHIENLLFTFLVCTLSDFQHIFMYNFYILDTLFFMLAFFHSLSSSHFFSPLNQSFVSHVLAMARAHINNLDCWTPQEFSKVHFRYWF